MLGPSANSRTGSTVCLLAYAPLGRYASRMLDRVKRGLRSHEEERLQRELDEAHATIKRLRRHLKEAESDPFPADKLVWIFGMGRSGSSWLAFMLREVPRGNTIWQEPWTSVCLGPVAGQEEGIERLRIREQTIFGSPFEEVWFASVRRMVLEGAAARFPRVGERSYLIVKEPNGSSAAPVLVKALPESEVIFLVRDPRDVAASMLDSVRPGGWREGRPGTRGPDDVIVSNSARTYVKNMDGAKRGFEAHRGPKVLVRYEDLRADALGELRRIYSELGLSASEEELARAVEKHAWENIPETKKGPGRSRRKAVPGSWREDLTQEQARRVEEITAPLLEEFYP